MEFWDFNKWWLSKIGSWGFLAKRGQQTDVEVVGAS